MRLCFLPNLIGCDNHHCYFVLTSRIDVALTITGQYSRILNIQGNSGIHHFLNKKTFENNCWCAIFCGPQKPMVVEKDACK